MKWMPDKIGGNPKQYATLGVLVGGADWMLHFAAR